MGKGGKAIILSIFDFLSYGRKMIQSNLSGDTFSIEAPQNLLRTKRRYSKNISSGKEFPFKSGSKLLRTLSWRAFRPRKKIFSPPPPNSPQTPSRPLDPPTCLGDPPPLWIFAKKPSPPPLPAPRTPPSRKKKISETSTELFWCLYGKGCKNVLFGP